MAAANVAITLPPLLDVLVTVDDDTDEFGVDAFLLSFRLPDRDGVTGLDFTINGGIHHVIARADEAVTM
jgi:hypothetical protein